MLYEATTVLGLQPQEEELLWNQRYGGKINGHKYQTQGQLIHRSNPATGDLRNRTQSLLISGFNFNNLPTVITGIEVTTKILRNGRVSDEIVQLSYQGSLIGKNNFNYYTDDEGRLVLHDTTTYGSPTDLWGYELTPEILQDPSFGVVLKLQAHPYYPHSCGAIIEAVSLTVY